MSLPRRRAVELARNSLKLVAKNAGAETYGGRRKRELCEEALGNLRGADLDHRSVESLVQVVRQLRSFLTFAERRELLPAVAELAAIVSMAGSGQQVLTRETFRQVEVTRRQPVRSQRRGVSSPAILVLAATRAEFEVAIDLAGVRSELSLRRQAVGDYLFVDLGFRSCPVWLFQCKQGAIGPGAATTRTMDALQTLKPRPFAVVVAGIAFGLRRGEQTMGDVLLAEQIRLYEVERYGDRRRVARGDRPATSDVLFDWFRSCEVDWSPNQAREQRPVVHSGLLMSGEKLVDDPAFVADLLRLEPEAIGGEMEVAGVYSAAYSRHTHWIVVKAICDWGMGKGDKYQKVAARNSLDYVFHVLDQPAIGDALRGHPDSRFWGLHQNLN